MEYRLKCLSCGRMHPPYYPSQLCETCGGILEVLYSGRPALKSLVKDFWSYESLLPKGEYKRYKLGNTTLLRATGEPLFLKLELENPTRSFKDRGSVVEIAKALEFGYDEVVVASTGNMAYSIAYYAKLAGIRSTVFVSRSANWLKVRNIRDTKDAKIFRVDGDFTEAQRRAMKYSKRRGAFLVGDYGYRKEGQKTVIYEIMAEMPDARNLFIPVGNATLFSASVKGAEELRRYGLAKGQPKLVAAQARLTNPVALAFRTRKPVRYQKPLTDAGAIAVGYPTYGDMAVEGIKATGGTAVEVTDNEMEEERNAFYREYGLQAEMAGVASLAAYRKAGMPGKSAAVVSGGNTLKPYPSWSSGD